MAFVEPAGSAVGINPKFLDLVSFIGFMSLPYPNTGILDDPELACESRVSQRVDQLGSDPHDMVAGLGARPKHNNSGIAVGRVCPDVRKIRTEGHDGSAFLHTDRRKIRAYHSSKILVEYGYSIVGSYAKHVREINRNILVKLESHAGFLWLESTTRSLARVAA